MSNDDGLGRALTGIAFVGGVGMLTVMLGAVIAEKVIKGRGL